MDGIRIGVCQWCLPAQGAAAIDLAGKLGFEGVALEMGTDKPEQDLTQPAVRRAFSEAATRNGLAYPALAVNEACRLGMNHAEREAEIFHLMEQAVYVASVMHIPALQLPSFFSGAIGSEEDLQQTARCLRHACLAAAPLGIRVGTENGLDAAGNDRLLQATDCRNLFVYFDTANPKWLGGGQSAPDLLRQQAGVVGEVHMKDVYLDDSGDMTGFAPLCQGDVDVMGSVKVLRERGYQGWLILDNEWPEEGLQRDLATLQALVKE